MHDLLEVCPPLLELCPPLLATLAWCEVFHWWIMYCCIGPIVISYLPVICLKCYISDSAKFRGCCISLFCANLKISGYSRCTCMYFLQKFWLFSIPNVCYQMFQMPFVHVILFIDGSSRKRADWVAASSGTVWCRCGEGSLWRDWVFQEYTIFHAIYI